MLLLDIPVYRCHLLHVQFACQDHHVGKLSVEFQRFGVGDIELGGQMYFLPDAVSILHDGYIAGDDGIDAYGMGFIHDLTHQRQVLGIHDRVDRQIGLHVRLATGCHNSSHVIRGEIHRTAGTHVQVLYSEIDTGSPCVYRSSQTLPASYRSHNFYL